MPPTAELHLLRIIQEALTNVRKHSGATAATIRLGETSGWLEAVVEDDGRGFDPSAPEPNIFPRFGLSTMRERAESVGGMLEIDSGAGRGTRVTIRIPSGATAPDATAGNHAHTDS